MSNVRDTEIEQMRKIIEASISNRGRVIDIAIDVENTLTDIITWCFYPSHYSPDKGTSEQLDENGVVLKSILVRKVYFRDKIEILKDIIMVKKPAIWESNRKLINNLRKELDRVREFRNLLAHSPLDISKEDLLILPRGSHKKGNNFQVLEYKKGKVIKHSITTKRIQTERFRMAGVSFTLYQLFSLLNDDLKNVSHYEHLSSLANRLINLSSQG